MKFVCGLLCCNSIVQFSRVNSVPPCQQHLSVSCYVHPSRLSYDAFKGSLYLLLRYRGAHGLDHWVLTYLAKQYS